MDTCTNCGATLRPGAKFCTTCGTRLNETTASSSDAYDGWGTPRSAPDDAAQETTVLNTVQQSEESDESPSITEVRQQTADAWSAAYGNATASTASDDPASRFISALDSDVEEVEGSGSEETSTPDPTSTWDTPAPVFTPPPPSNWSYSAGKAPEAPTTDTSEGSNWNAPSTWGDVQSTEAPVIAGDEIAESAWFSDDGNDAVDSLNGDEAAEVSGEPDVELAPDEARDHALALADELRRTIRMMGSAGESDHGAAVMALTEASLHVGDFSDVRGVLADVKNDPRDIQTLGELASKVDRIEALLDDHKSLADAIETAIKELNGYGHSGSL